MFEVEYNLSVVAREKLPSTKRRGWVARLCHSIENYVREKETDIIISPSKRPTTCSSLLQIVTPAPLYIHDGNLHGRLSMIY